MGIINLDKHEVHLWDAKLSALDHALPTADALLSTNEQQRAWRFVTDDLRRRYIAATLALRQVLAYYLGCSPQHVQFRWGPHGKPYLQSAHDLQFNLSNTQDRVLIAVTKQQEVGVDIECHNRKDLAVEAIAKRFFAAEEYQALLQLPQEARILAFYRIWTRKEAFIKATGQGLSFGLNNFTVNFTQEGLDCLLSVNGSAELAKQWSLGPILQTEQGYTAALAVHGLVNKLHYRRELPTSFEK